MNGMMESFASFRVLEGTDTVLSWYIAPVDDGKTFASTIEDIRDASQDGGPRFSRALDKEMALPRCFVSKSATEDPSAGMEVGLQLPVRRVCHQFGAYVTFVIPKPVEEPASDNDRTSTPRRNAFAVLAEGARAQTISRSLPEKKGVANATGTATRGDWRLHNDLCDALEEEAVGFRSAQVATVGKEVLNTLTDVLFEVSGLVPPLVDRVISRS